MIALYIILGILAFILLLSCTRYGVEVRYEDEFELFVRASVLRIRLLPRKPKKPKKPKKEKSKKEKPEKEKKEKEPKKEDEEKPKGENPLVRFYRSQGFDGVMQLLADVIAALNSMLGDIYKHTFVLEKLMLRLRVCRADAAETALAYGKTCAAVYPALGYICSNLTVRQYDADIQADYLGNHSTAAVWFVLTVRPIRLIRVVMRFVFRALVAIVKARIRASKRKKQMKQLSTERNVQS